MKYSVLMSVYKNDDPEFLRQALVSTYEEQTRKPDEIVIVFDGPLTEELCSVLNDFRNGKEDVVFFYPQEVNRGLGEALRIGSGYCTGDYIFRMDSDDINHPMRFEKQANFVETHGDVDVVGTDISEFYQSHNEPNQRSRVCPAEHKDIVEMGKTRNPMNHVTVCMKRDALEKCGGYESLLLLEDYYLWLKMIVSGCKLANLHENLVYVRVGNGFESKRSSSVRIKGWKVLQKFMLQNKMIGKVDACKNMMIIRLFVWTPPKIKGWLYKVFLRK